MGESRVENPERENRWGIMSRTSRQRKPMGESRVENPERKSMGESRVENLDRENRWGNQESKI